MSLFIYGSLESHHGSGGLMGLVVVYGGPTLDKYYCVVTRIGDDDPCRRHKIPHLWWLGAKKQYYSVVFNITAVTCNLACISWESFCSSKNSSMYRSYGPRKFVPVPVRSLVDFNLRQCTFRTLKQPLCSRLTWFLQVNMCFIPFGQGCCISGTPLWAHIRATFFVRLCKFVVSLPILARSASWR